MTPSPNGTPAIVRAAAPILSNRSVKMICVTVFCIAALHYGVLVAQIVLLFSAQHPKPEFRAEPTLQPPTGLRIVPRPPVSRQQPGEQL